MQKIHAATHPGATLERKANAATSEDTDPDDEKAALLAALEAEVPEDA